MNWKPNWAFSFEYVPEDSRMTFQESDPNRRTSDRPVIDQPLSDLHVRRPVYERSSGAAWIVPLVLLAVLAIGGMMIYSSSDNTTTASNNTPAATTQTAPAGPARVPAPAPAPPAKTQ